MAQTKDLHKVVEIYQNALVFDNRAHIWADDGADDGSEDWDCCFLMLENLNINDFDGLLFDLSSDNFVELVPDYGIRLVAENGTKIDLPAWGGDKDFFQEKDVILYLTKKCEILKKWNISLCQPYTVKNKNYPGECRWVSVEERGLPKELETVWLYNDESGEVALGCTIYFEDEDKEDECWGVALTNGKIYSENGRIVSECDDDFDFEFTHWCRLPSLPNLKD